MDKTKDTIQGMDFCRNLLIQHAPILMLAPSHPVRHAHVIQSCFEAGELAVHVYPGWASDIEKLATHTYGHICQQCADHSIIVRRTEPLFSSLCCEIDTEPVIGRGIVIYMYIMLCSSHCLLLTNKTKIDKHCTSPCFQT